MRVRSLVVKNSTMLKVPAVKGGRHLDDGKRRDHQARPVAGEEFDTPGTASQPSTARARHRSRQPREDMHGLGPPPSANLQPGKPCVRDGTDELFTQLKAYICACSHSPPCKR
jgi:hypothetical protein